MTTQEQSEIRSLYPSLSEAEAWKAQENMASYLALVARIYQRIAEDPQALAELRAAIVSESANAS